MARTYLKSLSVAAFIVFLAVFAVQYTQPSRPTAAFAPESIGLGQGVAACFSGTPTITCNSAGQYVFTVSLQDPPDSLNIQGFRVIFVTDLNNPEGSVKAEINNISSSGGTYTTTFTGSAGTQYWPIELRYADGTWTYSAVASGVIGPTCTIPTAAVQGYKVDSNRQAGFAEQTITVQGGNQSPSSGTNPYQIYGLTPGGYNVTSSVPSDHSVSYCVGGGCSYYTPGNNVNVTAPSGSAVDLWWQYSPWTTYCTTGGDTNNPWEWWRHDAVANPNTHYEFVRNGDGTCLPSAPTVSAQCHADNQHVNIYWTAPAGASLYAPRINGGITEAACEAQPSPNWTWHPDGYCYVDDMSGTSVSTFPITPNTNYSFWVHARAGESGWGTAGGVNFNCSPTPTGTLTLKTNPCTIAAGQTTCQPYFDWATANTYQGSDGRVAFNIINNAGTGVYATETAYAGRGSTPASGTDGYGAALSEGSYTIKLYGFSLSANNWVLLDSEIQVVNSNSADLTVSGITPTSAIAGTATTFSATIYNTGTGSTGIGFKNFYQVKSGTVGYTTHNLFAKLFNIAHAAETITDLTATTMSALAARGNGTATQTYTFPAAGIYGIRVCADKADRNGTNGNPNGEISESNELNNCGGWTDVNVTAACTPGASCSASNACNYASGTYDSSCNCSATVPPVPANYGNACPSTPPTNVCGQAGSGTILCNGTCSAVTPPDTQCYPTVSLSADPTRVRSGGSTTLSWTTSGATSCTLTGQNGLNLSVAAGSLAAGSAVSNTNSGLPIDAETTFTLRCTNAYGAATDSETVTLVPVFIEI